MKLSALRQLVHDLKDMPDDMDLGFMSDDGEDYSINAALPDLDNGVLYFGESENGLIEAYEEYLRGFQATDDWEYDEAGPDDDYPTDAEREHLAQLESDAKDAVLESLDRMRSRDLEDLN